MFKQEYIPVGCVPAVNRITDTSKNITLATTSFRPVKKKEQHNFETDMESLFRY